MRIVCPGINCKTFKRVLFQRLMQESKFLSKCPLMLGTYGPDHNGKPTTRSVKAKISIHFISFHFVTGKKVIGKTFLSLPNTPNSS